MIITQHFTKIQVKYEKNYNGYQITLYFDKLY